MIKETLTHISNELNTFLKDKYGITENKVIANQLVDEKGNMPLENSNKLVLTMIDVMKDNNVRQNTGFVRNNMGAASTHMVYHLELLLSGMFDDYNESLTFVSSTMELLEDKSIIFDRENSEEAGGKISQISVELTNISTEDSHHLWASLKMPKRPSLFLKARILTE